MSGAPLPRARPARDESEGDEVEIGARAGSPRPRRRSTDDHGLSLLVTAVGLLISALLVLLVLKPTVGSGSGSGSTNSTPHPVAVADAALAQQNLSGAFATLQQVDAGGQGSVEAPTLQAADPSLDFTTGPSSAPATLSVTPSADGTSVALADRSSDGTCWVVWWSSSTGAWYGAQTAQPSCTAPSASGGPVTSSGIGWQQGSFPTA
jgi:hypothetical protein